MLKSVSWAFGGTRLPTGFDLQRGLLDGQPVFDGNVFGQLPGCHREFFVGLFVVVWEPDQCRYEAISRVRSRVNDELTTDV
jgi:hypothetical protein